MKTPYTNQPQHPPTETAPQLQAGYSLYMQWGIVFIIIVACAITWINVLLPWQQFNIAGNDFYKLLLAIALTLAATYALLELFNKKPQLVINQKGVYRKQWLFLKKPYRFVPWENLWYYHFSYEGDDKKLFLYLKTKTEELLKIRVHGLNTDEVALMEIFEHYAAQYDFKFLEP
jgi:hypothetical protein